MFNHIFLASIIEPELGLIFWSVLTFGLLLIVLKRIAWKPIMTGIQERETSITNALAEAEKARAEMRNLHSENEKLLQDARNERDKMLKEAKEIKDKIVSDAKNAAAEEVKLMRIQATEAIEKEKESAKRELKDFTVNLAMEAASKILRTELAHSDVQEALVDSLISSSANNI